MTLPIIKLSAAILMAGILTSQGKPSGDKAAARKSAPAVKPVDFTREVQPILSRNCLACHGMDEKARKGELRLDLRDQAVDKKAIVPGNAPQSLMIQRLHSTDPEEVMPPPDKHDALTSHEVELLTRWITEGAEYAPHWAFQKLKPVELPQLPPAPESTPARKGQKPRKSAAPDPWAGWRGHPVDQLTGSYLAEKGIVPSPQAQRPEWLRRVTYDLTGLPPTEGEIDTFLKDEDPYAYEHVVDRLLSSPAYGEHMAVHWLDAARYGDTYGRHEDEECTTWPWRDWVIRAFQENLSYDKFILWQTAGDLMESPTQDMLIATCFNRLPQQSNEAGSNPEEFRMEQVADRVHTNGMVWMGLSMECARCHDHKYDPITQQDYYKMSAFLNNIDELGLFAVYTGATPPPVLRLYDDAQEKELTAARNAINLLLTEKESLANAAAGRFKKWMETFPEESVGKFPLRPVSYLPLDTYKDQATPDIAAKSKPATSKTKLLTFPGKIGNAIRPEKENMLSINSIPEVSRADPFSMGLWIKIDAPTKRATLVHRSRSGIDAGNRGIELVIENDFVDFALVWFSPGDEARIRSKQKLVPLEWTHVFVTSDGSGRTSGMKLYLNGVPAEVDSIRDCLEGEITYRDAWGDNRAKDATEVSFSLMGRKNDAPYVNGLMDEFYFFDEELTSAEVRRVARMDSKPTEPELFAYYCRRVDAEYKTWLKSLWQARETLAALPQKATPLMIMKEWSGPARATHVLTKGQFDAPREAVTAGTPASLPAMPPGAPQNRLGYAQWLISPEHPLTARVAVNRFWQMFFGRGIVDTPEDFGTQGQLPSHPLLLDWMAQDFISGGWDVKKLIRTIVLSGTYRQSARPADPSLLEKDPTNEWLARGPRQRLSGESLRDTMLAASGLLDRSIGGPPVKPYQPAGLWEEGGTQHEYVQDHGSKLYRRSLYTFWRRTMPPPSMIAFDAPTREFCRVRRAATATPAQALVLMNDPQFLEAGRVFAESLVKASPAAPEVRARKAWKTLTSREINPAQLRILTDSYTRDLTRYQATPDAAEELLKIGEHPRDPQLPGPETAATTLLIRMVLSTLEANTNS